MLGLDIQFVILVDFAPMALLRSAFRYVGGLDEGLSDPGMCGICKKISGQISAMILLSRFDLSPAAAAGYLTYHQQQQQGT
jgi:hypothetical protein